jgi:hypothetical protein
MCHRLRQRLTCAWRFLGVVPTASNDIYYMHVHTMPAQALHGFLTLYTHHVATSDQVDTTIIERQWLQQPWQCCNPDVSRCSQFCTYTSCRTGRTRAGQVLSRMLPQGRLAWIVSPVRILLKLCFSQARQAQQQSIRHTIQQSW